jgi:hypothetical protein
MNPRFATSFGFYAIEIRTIADKHQMKQGQASTHLSARLDEKRQLLALVHASAVQRNTSGRLDAELAAHSICGRLTDRCHCCSESIVSDSVVHDGDPRGWNAARFDNRLARFSVRKPPVSASRQACLEALPQLVAGLRLEVLPMPPERDPWIAAEMSLRKQYVVEEKSIRLLYDDKVERLEIAEALLPDNLPARPA